MFQCPKCKDDNLRIRHLVMHYTDVNRDEEVEDSEPQDLEWDNKDEAECLDCDWSGKVKDISMEEYEEETA